MTDIPLHYRSATELGAMLRTRQVSSMELTTLYLERLEKQGRALNALAELTRELALAQAKQADAELAAGTVRSPMHGVPYGAKDLLDTAGIPTRWGSPAHADRVPEVDAEVVQRLRDAGAVLIGKLAMVELAGGGGYAYPAASLDGPGRCPWNPERWSGGSSSGSGSAVGAGVVGFAIGTETWGSITVPAAFCGITGLRPTYGRVPRTGAMALCWTLDKIGPMARSAEDCGHILQIISGPEPGESSRLSGSFAFVPQPSLRYQERPIRIGILSHDYTGVPEVKARFHAAVEVFRDGGCALLEADYPSEFPYNNITGVIVHAEGSAAFEGLIRSDRLRLLADTEQQSGLIAGLSISASDYLHALRAREVARIALNSMWKQYDALIAPTLLTVAPPIEQSLHESTQPWGGNGGSGNLAGWPSISIPMGYGKGNLPLGLEIIGPPLGEQIVLSLAMAYQCETNWHRQHPESRSL